MKIIAFLRSVASVAIGLSLSGAALATDLAPMTIAPPVDRFGAEDL